MKSQSKDTICVHEGNKANSSGSINNPIVTSTAYAYLDSDKQTYPRYFNVENQEVLIQKIARLEKAETGLIFGSGMAAISTTILSLLSKGDHIIFQYGLYGGTINFILMDLERFGIEFTMLDDNTVKTIKKAVKKNTKALYVETPSNPLLAITNLEEVNSICKSNNLISIIDNTFASPINQTPIDFGIDLVIHSATKYLGGHSDIQAGVVVSSKVLTDKIRKMALNLGGSLNAMMCHLLERSLKTLAIRVKQQNSNAMQVAEFLSSHQSVSRVYYPGLSNHPGHEIAKKQMNDFGGMVSFDLIGISTDTFQKNLKLIKPALSLGGVESTICSPATTSHRHLSNQQREKDGIGQNLLRLSVGIEDVNDLIQDLSMVLDDLS